MNTPILSLRDRTIPFDLISVDDLQIMSRDALIRWLTWNDRNGAYTDADQIAEGWPPLDREMLIEIATIQINGE